MIEGGRAPYVIRNMHRIFTESFDYLVAGLHIFPSPCAFLLYKYVSAYTPTMCFTSIIYASLYVAVRPAAYTWLPATIHKLSSPDTQHGPADALEQFARHSFLTCGNPSFD